VKEMLKDISGYGDEDSRKRKRFKRDDFSLKGAVLDMLTPNVFRRNTTK